MKKIALIMKITYFSEKKKQQQKNKKKNKEGFQDLHGGEEIRVVGQNIYQCLFLQ